MSIPRLLRDLRFHLFYWWAIKRRTPLKTLGTTCQWTISEQDLGPNSNILCAGAGYDISFELSLISSHGCSVVLLDPSPPGIETVAKANLPESQLKFMPIALGGVDGSIGFRAAHDPTEGSFVGDESTSGAFQFPCKTLPTLLAELGWSQIDLLKIDIEGFEYPVLQDILDRGLNVKQICVEFHHGPQFGRANSETVRMILALRRAGYDLVHRFYWDHTFILRET